MTLISQKSKIFASFPQGKPLLHFYPLRGIISQKIATPVCALARNDTKNWELTMTKILFVCHGKIPPNFEKCLCL